MAGSGATPGQVPASGEPRLRRATFLVLLSGALFSAAALVWQWARWDSPSAESLATLGWLLAIFWSPYAGLALVAAWLGRRVPRAAVTLAGAVLVVLWGVYWHIDLLFVQPGVMSEIVSPLLIPGCQWLGVAGTAALAVVLGWILPRGPGPAAAVVLLALLA